MVIHPDGFFKYTEDEYGIAKKMMKKELDSHRGILEKVHENKNFS